MGKSKLKKMKKRLSTLEENVAELEDQFQTLLAALMHADDIQLVQVDDESSDRKPN